jgi:hypothetical protein
MDRHEIKRRIRTGEPTLGVDRDLFEAAYASADRHRFTLPATQIVTNQISNVRLDDTG